MSEANNDQGLFLLELQQSYPWMPRCFPLGNLQHEDFREVLIAFEENCERVWALDKYVRQAIEAAAYAGWVDGGRRTMFFPGDARDYLKKINTDPRLHTPEVTRALRLLCLNQVAAMWTSFEALAGDLWEVVVNAYPVLRGNAEHRIKKSFPGGPLTTFDVAWHFNGIDGICEAFQETFTPFGTIEFANVFDSMRTLALLRHVIVHRGGVVDQRAVDTAQKMGVTFIWQPGQQLEIRKQEVLEMFRTMSAAANQLIALVRLWHDGQTP